MPLKDTQFRILATAAMLAIAFGSAAPLWAATTAPRPADSVAAGPLLFGPPSSPLHVLDLRLAMMDDMDMMKKKGGMGGKAPGTTRGGMPSTDPMPTGELGAMQDPPAATPGADMMGRAPGMGNMAATSQLPGFPGASHLYHVGATSFFLDHPQHITLSIEQQTALNQIKEKVLLDQASSERRISEAEQELWTLTAAAAPDAARIDAQVRAIEKLRGDQRLAFIRAVGEATKILTVDQRLAVLGTKPQAPGAPASASKPAPMTTMPHR